MTLGGMALAVGILVDDATVEIENTHRNMAMRKPLVRAVLDGAQQIAVPAFVSTLSICIVFVPVLLLTGAARFLFTPLAMAVVFAMLASYFLSRTLIPTMVHYMLGPEVRSTRRASTANRRGGKGLIWRVHYLFNRRFERMRASYTGLLHWALRPPRPGAGRFRHVRGRILCAGRLSSAGISSPRSIPARCGCTRARPRARASKKTEVHLRRDRRRNPAASFRRAKSTPSSTTSASPPAASTWHSATATTLGAGDGDILISLKPEEHGPTADYTDQLRKRLHERFPDVAVLLRGRPTSPTRF